MLKPEPEGTASSMQTLLLDTDELNLFKKGVYRLTNVDLADYKPAQVQRLINSLMRRHGFDSYAEYLARLRRDPGLLAEFRSHMSINVSEFFRDAEQFNHLAKLVLPSLLKTFRRPRVWSAGCSSGCEPYSVALLLDQMRALARSNLLATDIDSDSLERARAGVYSASELRNVALTTRQRYFTELKDGRYQIASEIQRAVRFQRHDLLRSERFPQGISLIICRNVVIYFTEEAKQRLYRRFCGSLAQGGYLFVGNTEIIFNARDLGLSNPAPFFYRRVE